MKLDVLMKLIALANNNPNDNEANLAARKACKAIIEYKFNITGGTITPPKQNPKPDYAEYSNPFGGRDPFSSAYSNMYEEFFGRGRSQRAGGGKSNPNYRPTDKQREYYESGDQWSGFGGSKQYKPKSEELNERERSWKYEFYQPATKTYYNPVTLKSYIKMFQDLWFEETGTRHVSDTAAFRADANYGKPQDEGNPYTGRPNGQKGQKSRYKGNESRKLKCKKCGQIFNTKFVGIEEMFECNNCQWTAYEKDKKPPKEEQKYGHICYMTGQECRTPVTCNDMGCSLRT